MAGSAELLLLWPWGATQEMKSAGEGDGEEEEEGEGVTHASCGGLMRLL